MESRKQASVPRMASYADAIQASTTAQDPLVTELVAARRMLECPDIREFLNLMVQRGASDLHIKVGSPPGLRVDGRMEPVGRDALSPDGTEALVRDVLTEAQFEQFVEEGDLDVAYTLPEISRFRVNTLIQRGSMGMVIRRIPEKVPTLAELNFPEVLSDLAEKPNGLVLVTGPTGSGKSTTLAAMVHHINTTRQGHIVTMEDPIEFVHQDQRCWVTQREIGTDCRSFSGALKRALRQDPDVIMVGEMRDLETISLAITAAETGHLVFATLHTTSAAQTISRIVDVFSADQQQQIRLQLADALQGIISQTLLPRRNGGRVAAMEILLAQDGVRAQIRENKTPQLHNFMQTGGKAGMQTLEAALNDLVARRVVDYGVAVAKANFPSQVQDPKKRKPAARPTPRPPPR
ncbi:MAG: type IV pilus twitching motility protein PilT [Planctomycetota bacterium]|jgi:twitching motility protein PilT